MDLPVFESITFARAARSGLPESGPALARDLPAAAGDLADLVLAALALAPRLRVGLLGRGGVAQDALDDGAVDAVADHLLPLGIPKRLDLLLWQVH